jgi:hypothetical protein
MTEYGRFRADLGLDTRLEQDTRNRGLSRSLDPRPVLARRATTGNLSNVVQPPMPAFHDSPSPPRIETIVPQSPRLVSTPARRTVASKSVLTRIGPHATAQVEEVRSGTGKVRRTWADIRRVARPIAIGVVVVSVSAPVGAAVPLLLSMLGR